MPHAHTSLPIQITSRWVFGFLAEDIKLWSGGATVDPSAVRADRQMCPHYRIQHVRASADDIMGYYHFGHSFKTHPLCNNSMTEAVNPERERESLWETIYCTVSTSESAFICSLEIKTAVTINEEHILVFFKAWSSSLLHGLLKAVYELLLWSLTHDVIRLINL